MTGGALSGEEILARSTGPHGPALISNLAPDNLKGAAYDLRMADDGFALPDGLTVRPGCGDHYKQAIVLHPGQTIFVSTAECLHLPSDLVGNISIKGALANQGVLALTGLIVDPNYQGGGSGDGRLHFRLANLGRSAVVLEPGKTRIASIQFVQLSTATARPANTSFVNVWEAPDQLAEGLGFLEDLRELRARVDAIDAEQSRQGRTIGLAVNAVLFVVVLTLLGVAMTGLLAFGSDPGLLEAASSVVPDETEPQLIGVAALFAVAAIAYSLTTGLHRRRHRDRPDSQTARYVREEAVATLRTERALRVATAAVVATLVVLAGVIAGVKTDLEWWAITLGALVVVLVLLIAAGRWLWRPIPRWRVEERIREWELESVRNLNS